MMNLSVVTLGAALLVAPSVALAQVETEPPGDPYQKVSDLVELPEFIPGLGALYVNPDTLPAGPFLAYDREGALVSTVYMIPLADLEGGNSFSDLDSPGGEVDHVDVQYNAGHPGVEEPHAHVILWHVSDTSKVAE